LNHHSVHRGFHVGFIQRTLLAQTIWPVLTFVGGARDSRQ
jgi:hypothetical protein